MAFSTRRGRPRAQTTPANDPGTPELRMKHALGLTHEPIDLCLARGLVTPDQHWCGLHLRWLYTLRYGAPSLTTRYVDTPSAAAEAEDSAHWRALREQEYADAITQLKTSQRYECIMRLCVFNELPSFLNHRLRQQAWSNPALTQQLTQAEQRTREGLELLVTLWRCRKPRQHYAR